MRPIRLTARGYRSFDVLDYTFVDGATAVTGANGAGKSSLIGAVEICLFGPRGRSLEPLVREGADEMQITLEFEHADRVYRVRRGWKSGRSTLDLEKREPVQSTRGPFETDDIFIACTQGAAADTQALIETTIGMNRATFTASGYLAQRASDTFTGAQPRDRKKILSDALALDQWQTDAEKVGADRRAVEKHLAEVSGRIDGLAERSAAAEALALERAELELAAAAAAAAENEARVAADQYAQRAADLDAAETAWQTRSAAVQVARARNDAHLAKLERTQQATAQRATLAADIAALGAPADLEALERQERDLIDQQSRYDRALADFDAATVRRDGLLSFAETAREHAAAFHAKAAAVLAAVVEQHCETCGQALGAEAAQTAAASYRAQAAEHTVKADLFDGEAKAVIVPPLPAPPDREALAMVRATLADARSQANRRTQIETQIAALDATIAETDNDGYRDQARLLSFELAEAEQALVALAQPEPGAADQARSAAAQARTQAEAHAARARQASERLAAVQALLEQAQAAAVEHAAAVLERDRLHGEIDILVRLEQAFGRDGIPAWIVESQALPHIEQEANRILARLGGAISRVELRTERETKAGDKRDALDVVCFTDDGERALETFSGGEQSRAEIALALGLVDVLQSRRDADLRYLALDEPSGLDGQGTEALAEILRERAVGTVVLLASHDPGLRDQFDQSIVVQRGPTGSEVTT